MPGAQGCVAFFLKIWPAGCFSAHAALCTLQVLLQPDRISNGEAEKLHRLQTLAAQKVIGLLPFGGVGESEICSAHLVFICFFMICQ